MESTMSCTIESPKTDHFKNIRRVGMESPHWFLQFSP
jgi:hypothetical protein